MALAGWSACLGSRQRSWPIPGSQAGPCGSRGAATAGTAGRAAAVTVPGCRRTRSNSCASGHRDKRSPAPPAAAGAPGRPHGLPPRRSRTLFSGLPRSFLKSVSRSRLPPSMAPAGPRGARGCGRERPAWSCCRGRESLPGGREQRGEQEDGRRGRAKVCKPKQRGAGHERQRATPRPPTRRWPMAPCSFHVPPPTPSASCLAC